MKHIGPYGFNAARFMLGALVIAPLVVKRQRGSSGIRSALRCGALAGMLLFAGSALQQVGIIYTSAANAGFITGLYVVIVPLLGTRFGHKVDRVTLLAAFMAAVGLYLLSVSDTLSIGRGDTLVLISALVWSAHILVIARFSPQVDTVCLAFVQFVVCAAISAGVAAWRETHGLQDYAQAALPLAYCGLISVGIGYTLQVVAQAFAHPAHAAIIMSLEAVFAALAGYLMLGEAMSLRGMVGACLMLAGMIMAQFSGSSRQEGSS